MARGNAGGVIILAIVVAIFSVGLMLSIAHRNDGRAATGINAMFAEAQASADAAAAASSPLTLDDDSACIVDRDNAIVRFHIAVHNADGIDGTTTARPVVRLANGDEIADRTHDRLLQIPAGETSITDPVVPYGDEEPAGCSVTLTVGAGGAVAMRS